jgi:alpha-ribazole phosphatase
MNLYLVRHPKPLVDDGVCYGATDLVCASSELQKAALGLRDSLPKGLRILSSPLQRCERFAQEIQRLAPDLAYKTDARLTEMSFGAWEMQAWNVLPPAELQAWTDDFSAYRCGGCGESAGQFVRRVAQLLMESAQTGHDQIWITHAGVIRAVQWLSGQSFEDFTALAAQRPEGLFHLRAADWPQSALAFGQGQAWRWPPSWPMD